MTGTGNVMIFKQFVECIRLITQSHEALLAGGIIRFFGTSICCFIYRILLVSEFVAKGGYYKVFKLC